MNGSTNNKTLYKFILPSVLIIFALTYIPLIYSFILTFYKGRGSNLSYAGFYNYESLLSDNSFLISLRNSALFTIILMPLLIVFSLWIALKITKLKKEKIQNIFITIFYIPCITSPVAYSLFFKQICYSDGIVSVLLQKMNLISNYSGVLQSVWGARLVIIFVCLWAWSGYYILLFITAIKSVDKDVYKAARIDGASPLKIFNKIILPSIKPVLILTTVMVATSSFQIYVESSILTKGGPQMATFTLVNYLYKKAFTYVSQYGYSSTIGIVIFIICITISILLIKRGDRYAK